jgi:WD40 repeat protein
VVAAGLVFAFVALAAGVVVHRIQTDKGELVITTESDDVEVTVKQGGKVVRIFDTKTQKSITLDSGEYELEVKDGKGLKLDLEKATLKRGKTVLARIERVEKPPSSSSPATVKAVEVFRKRWDGEHVSGLDLSPNGSRLIVMRWGDVLVIDVPTGKIVHKLTGFHGRFTPDGKLLVTQRYADRQDSLRVHDAVSGKLLREIFLVSNGERCGFLILCPDSRTVRVAFKGGQGQYWDLYTGKQLAEKDSSPWLSATFWGSKDVAAFSKTQRQQDPGFIIECVLPGNRQVMARYPLKDRAFPIYDVRSGRLARTIPLRGVVRIGEHFFSCVYGRERCARVAVWRTNGLIHVLDLVAGKEIGQFDPGNFQAMHVALSADDRFVAASSWGEATDVAVWRLDDLPAAKDKR